MPPSRHFKPAVGTLGIAALAVSILAFQPYQVNVANYTVVRAAQPFTATTAGFLLTIVAALGFLCVRGARGGADAIGRRIRSALSPLLLNAPLAALASTGRGIPFFLTLVLVLSTAWCAARLAALGSDEDAPRVSNRAALTVLTIAILAATAIHAQIQQNFFEHLMLGHSDIGHFTEELKNALVGRGLRSDSFENTRLGWHFTPLLYALTPLYALWPSPRLLMVCGPLLLQIPALAMYLTTRAWTGSAGIGLLVALAWLLHPSIGRMVYASTYGFAWIYACVPLLAFALWAVFGRRLVLTGLFLVLVWLCEETTTATTLGLGVCLAVFTRYRKVGIGVALVSLGYYLLCTRLMIPHFAASGRYERFSLFGELGDGPLAILNTLATDPKAWVTRLCRSSDGYFVMLWLAPMALLPLARWRLALAVLPVAGLVLLLQNPEWLSIKFWHQASILPVLFFAAILVFRPDAAEKVGRRAFFDRLLGSGLLSHTMRSRCLAIGMVFAAAMGHYCYGFSPLAKSFEPYLHDLALSQPDPRFGFVQELRASIPRSTTILATERVAAHFTDCRELYTGRRVRPADFVILDRADEWDTSGLPGRWGEFAASPEYELWKEFGSIVVFRHR